MDLTQYIGRVPDFPKPGILFYDISPLLASPIAWQYAINQLTKQLQSYQADLLIGIESRGFLLAAPLAISLQLGFAMVRKKGKLPGKTVRHEYALEYGTDTLEIQQNTLKAGKKAIIVDDLLATGGTIEATTKLLQQVGMAVSATACIIELGFLKGRSKIVTPFHSLINFP